MNYTCWFSDERAAQIPLVGGKGANLSRLTSGGFPVPPGFCITVDAYRYLLKVTGLTPLIAGLVEEIDFQEQEDIANKSQAIRELIEQQPIPTEIAGEVLEKYVTLGRQMECRHLEGMPVAVRSSATAEDLPGASFAGQQDTYLNIRGGTSLLEHARRCWASLWTERALTYRSRKGFDHNKVFVAVVVQAMVDPEVSGILFTANPISGRRNECVINASWGLGEAIVSGIVSPDTFIIDKRNGHVIQQNTARKETQVVFSAHSGAVEEKVPERRQQESSLSAAQAAHLTALASRIENYYGTPQDIEWARSDGEWVILQARPITTLEKTSTITTKSGTYSRAMFSEIFPDGLTPSFLSVVCRLLSGMMPHAFQELGFKHQPQIEPVAAFLNQPYLSVDYIEEVLRDLDPRVRSHLVAKFSNIFAHEEEQGMNLARLKLAMRLFRFVRRFQHDIPGLLARYHREIELINAISIEGKSDLELLKYVQKISYEGAGRLLNNDFLLIAAVGAYRDLLLRLLTPAYGDQAAEIVNNLLSGVSGNVVMETNKLIWNLAQTARSHPRVKRILQETNPEETLAALRVMPEAEGFLEQLQALLQECGHREQRFDICYPTWGEDPLPVLAFVRSYLDVDSSSSPILREEKLVVERESLTNKVIENFSQTFLGRILWRPTFRYLLRQTQWLARQRDTMHFEWTRIFPPARRMQLEIGRRWQQRNLLDNAQDIFFLTLPEQEEMAKFPRPLQKLIHQRREMYETNVSGPWPTLISEGRPVDSQPAPSAPVTTNGSSSITGVAGSPGQAEGLVRIVQGPQDFQKLQPGEILVAPMTNPVWTPLFAIAGGIITETGGILSHGAIVAREYGIPAVMSVPGVTRLLTNGQNVLVDGDRGLVIQSPKSAAKPHTFAGNHTNLAHRSTTEPLK